MGLGIEDVRAEVLKLLGESEADTSVPESGGSAPVLDRLTDRRRKVMTLARKVADRFDHDTGRSKVGRGPPPLTLTAGAGNGRFFFNSGTFGDALVIDSSFCPVPPARATRAIETARTPEETNGDFLPGELISVSITLSDIRAADGGCTAPAGVVVRETPPAGWVPSVISESGAYDPPSGTITWTIAVSAGFRDATTDEERKTAVERLHEFSLRFLELAEKHPEDPIAIEVSAQVVRVVNAVDSLTQVAWEMSTTVFPQRGKDDPGGGVVALLQRDHARSEMLGLVCERMTYGIRKEFETFLREVLKTNPHKDVQALACLALAESLNTRLQKLDLVEDRPELAERYEDLFGKDYYEELGRRYRAGAGKEVEAFFEQAAETYGDVKLPYGGTVGERAKSRLFEIRHLAIGEEAPDIEGEDQHGTRFKLSDYRGKVVLLDFWQEY
jgi:hypothetical protein